MERNSKQTASSTLPRSQPRNPSLDCMRIFGLYAAIGYHFFARTPFYSTVVNSFPMFLAVTARSFFLVCIPIFLILSGYLLSTRTMSAEYYKRIIPILITYSFGCITVFAYRIAFNDYSFRIGSFINDFLSCTISVYSWYIYMYIGLFLLIPILNAAFHYLDTKRKKQILVGTFLVLTILPSVFSVYNFGSLSWWKKPSSSSYFYKILPTYWQIDRMCYITYYYIGCYLKHCPIKITTRSAVRWICFSTIIAGLYNYWRSYGAVFAWGSWSVYESAFVALQATSIAVFFTSLSFKNISKGLAHLVQEISKCCEGAVMMSEIVDSFTYKRLFGGSYQFLDAFPYCLLVISGIFMASLCLSSVLHYLQDLCLRLGRVRGTILGFTYCIIVCTLAFLIR